MIAGIANHSVGGRILRALSEAGGKVVTHEQLKAAVWPTGHAPGRPRLCVRVQIHKLRRQLAAAPSHGCRIESLLNQGYRLVSEASQAAPEQDSSNAATGG